MNPNPPPPLLEKGSFVDFDEKGSFAVEAKGSVVLDPNGSAADVFEEANGSFADDVNGSSALLLLAKGSFDVLLESEANGSLPLKGWL